MNYYLALIRFNHEDYYVIFEFNAREMETWRILRGINTDEILMYCFKQELFPTHHRGFILLQTTKVSAKFVEDFGDAYTKITVSEDYLP